jgi:hypothetical protein
MRVDLQNSVEDHQYNMNDLTQIFLKLKDENGNVFIQQFGSEVFIYRSLGRAEYKKLFKEDNEFSDPEKEDILCQACVLWPEDYDWDNCDAGIPTKLSRIILKNSYMDSSETQLAVINYFREEMFDLDNQITCIINEAFPQFDIEEIEAWDVAKTAKYLSRAEWKLQNFRGMNVAFDPFAGQPAQEQQAPQTPQQRQMVKTEEIGETEDPKKAINGAKKEKMTPQKLAELKNKFPEINWEADEVFQKGLDALQDSVELTSPALRPGGR